MADSTTALIAAGAPPVVAGSGAIGAGTAQIRTTSNEPGLQRDPKKLQRLQAELDDRRAERAARHDCGYDALKRRYADQGESPDAAAIVSAPRRCPDAFAERLEEAG